MKRSTYFSILALLREAFPSLIEKHGESYARRLLRDRIDDNDKGTIQEVERFLELPAYREHDEMRRHFLGKVRGRFTHRELVALAAAMPKADLISSQRFVPSLFVASLAALDYEERHFDKAGVSWPVLRTKLEYMTDAEAFFFIARLEELGEDEDEVLEFVDYFLFQTAQVFMGLLKNHEVYENLKHHFTTNTISFRKNGDSFTVTGERLLLEVRKNGVLIKVTEEPEEVLEYLKNI